MSTKTFSSRADEGALDFADALVRQEYGLSYGQYCGTILLEAIKRTGKMPELATQAVDERKQQAIAFIKGFSFRGKNREIGKLSDAEVRELIASRYA